MKKFIALILIAIMAFSLCACSTQYTTPAADQHFVLESPLQGEFTVMEKYMGYDGSVAKYHILLQGEGYTLFMGAPKEVFAMLLVGDVCHGEVVHESSVPTSIVHILTTNIGQLRGSMWKTIPVE